MLKTPPLQTATATIDTLCGRLQSATLLEDRRAAILGLRSFAKQYPASVAGGSLRELITILRRDGLGEAGSTKHGRDDRDRGKEEGDDVGDVDTIRLVLETVLTLFNPDNNSPEASDELAYFMADEFSMRQDNVTLLLSLLDPASPFADYYSRLYSIQILQAISGTRPERLQECVLSAPLGVSRLVGILDDTRDAVRNAGLLLLVDLTSGASEELRKIVAFEDVFGKVFGLIGAEGGLAEAGITAQDCLILLANLIRGSPSNQTMFRESGCVSQMVRMLADASPPYAPEAAFLAQSREKGVWGLLQLLNFFLIPGEKSTAPNQVAYFKVGTAQVLIDLGFSERLPPPVRTLALTSAAALISSNAPLQEAFASLSVEMPGISVPDTKPRPQINGTHSGAPSARGSARTSTEQPRQYIIEALLNLTLSSPQQDPKLRMAGCDLVRAYLSNHDRIKTHFLQRAIGGHAEHELAANALNNLAQPADDVQSVLYASWIVTDLISDVDEAKAALVAVKEGNVDEGEDVLTLVQTLGSHLQAALHSGDERPVAAYAGLLTVLLWEYADGIDNLLAEGSGLLQELIAAADPAAGSPLIAGLAAILLGTIYEFSTKDSPIPRRTLAPLLTQKLGRSKYLESLNTLRKQPAIRDFDLDGDAEDTLLCTPFTDLFMTEYSRLRKAIDKDPGIEVLPSSATEAGVDRDLLDDLRQQLQSVRESLTQAQQDTLAVSQQHEQDRMAVAKDHQTMVAEVDRLRRINQAMQQGHESELEKLAQQHSRAQQQMQMEYQRSAEAIKQEAARQLETRLREQGAASAQKIQEYERRIAEMGNTQRSEQSRHADTTRQLESFKARHTELSATEQQLRQSLQDLTQRHEKMAHEHAQVSAEAEKSSAELKTVKSDSEKREDLVLRMTMQVKELREELKGREDELKTERAGFAELEKETETLKTKLTKAQVDAAKASAASAMSAEKAGDNKKIQEKIEQLEKVATEAIEGEKSAKEELESMLLVMGDIEAKRDELRAKVKELGGAVSDDEDEDGDEDEEDEGDID